MSNIIQTIEVDATTVLNAINGVLPILEQAGVVSAAATGPIGLGVSAAALVAQNLLPLIEGLLAKGIITVEQQAVLAARIQTITSAAGFVGPQWQPRPEPITPIPPA